MRSHTTKIVATASLMIAVVLAVGAWYYNDQRAKLRTQAEQSLKTVAELKAMQITDWRAERLGDAYVITDSPFLISAITQWMMDPTPELTDKLSDRLDSLERRYKYDIVYIVDASGKPLLGKNRIEQKNLTNTETIRAISKSVISRKPMLTDLHMDIFEGTPNMDAIAPIISNNRAIGAVVMTCNAERYLYPLIRMWPSPSASGETLIVRRDGDSVLFLNELKHSHDTALKLRIPMTKTNVPAVMAINGTEGIVEGVDYRGTPVIAAIKHIRDTDWHMVAKVDKDEILSAWRTRSYLITALLVAIISVIIAAAGFAYAGVERAQYKKLYRAESKLNESLERYRVTLMSVGDAVIATDAQGRVQMMNKVAETLTGWSESDAVGKALEDVFNIVNEETLKPVENPVRRVVAEGKIVGLANHTMLISRIGDQRPIADSAAPIHDETGSIIGTVLIFRDQSEEREKQEALRRSEEANRTLISALPDIIMRFDRQMRHIFVSENVDIISTFPAEDYIGKTHRELGFPEEKCKYWEEAIAGVFETGNQFEAEWGFDSKKGRTIINWRLIPEKDEKGDIATVLSITRDITEHRNIEKSYQSLFNEMLDGFALHEIICDENGEPVDYRFLAINPSFEVLTGLKGSDIIGKTVLEALPGTEKSWIEKYGRVALTGEPIRFEDYSRALNKHFEVTAFQPAPGQFACIFADVTDRKLAEEEAAKLQEQLLQSQKMEAIGQLAGGMAHDFNNMLGVIMGATELARYDVPENSPAQAELRTVLDAVRKARDLTMKLLTFSRMDKIEVRGVNVGGIIKNVEAMLSRTAPKSIVIKTEVEEGCAISCDRNQMEQALLNVCNNAIDAMPTGGELSIEASEIAITGGVCPVCGQPMSGRYCLLQVSDTGVGIAKEILGKITEPFFTTKGIGKGTGLGMSVTQGIVQTHNGHLHIYSEPGAGTCVKMYLPIEEDSESKGEARVEKRSCRGSETILVVDDEPEMLKTTAGSLKKYGYTPLTAENGEAAIEIYKEKMSEIAAVALDLMMPGIDGAEVNRRLKEINPDVKIVYISGFSESGMARELLKEPLRKFAQKPFEAGTLCEALRELIDDERGAMRDEA